MLTTHAGRWADFLDTCAVGEFEYPKSTTYALLDGGASQHVVDRWRDALQEIAGDRAQEPGSVRIGGERGGVAVFVEADETIRNRRKRTRMRAVGRPKKRWIPGAVAGLRDARFAPRVLARAEDAINGRPSVAHELRMAFDERGIQRGAHIVHDGWGATVAMSRRELEMANTAAAHARGEIVVATS